MDLSIGLGQEKASHNQFTGFRIVYLYKQLMQKTGEPVKNSVVFFHQRMNPLVNKKDCKLLIIKLTNEFEYCESRKEKYKFSLTSGL